MRRSSTQAGPFPFAPPLHLMCAPELRLKLVFQLCHYRGVNRKSGRPLKRLASRCDSPNTIPNQIGQQHICSFFGFGRAHQRRQCIAHAGRQAARTPGLVEHRCIDMRAPQLVFRFSFRAEPPDHLLRLDPRPARADIARMHFEPVIDTCGAQKVDFHPVYGKGDRIIAIKQIGVMNSGEPQKVWPPPLCKAEIVRVIDNAGEIRVLVIDADGELMDLPLDPPGKIRPDCPAHASSSPSSKSMGWFDWLALAGMATPICAKAAAVRMRPRGVRFTSPCWMR